MGDDPTRFIGIFAVVFFVLTLLSGAGFFGAIVATLVASVIVYFVMRSTDEIEQGDRYPIAKPSFASATF